jgi:hypothetical protein
MVAIVGNHTRRVKRRNVTILTSWGAELRKDDGRQNHFFLGGSAYALRGYGVTCLPARCRAITVAASL